MSFAEFTEALRKIVESEQAEARIAGDLLTEINKFFFQKDSTASKEEFSPFHAYWAAHAEEVLGLYIDDQACSLVADVLDACHAQYGAYLTTPSVAGIDPGDLPNIRLFTAVQDFRFDIARATNPYKVALEKPYLFIARDILANHPANINELLDELGITGQIDKRIEWASRLASWLVDEFDGSAANLGTSFNYEVEAMRTALVGLNAGFSNKKANMFLRDMLDMGIWRYRTGIETLDVAADANLIKVALRTGILRTRIPLLSSFLDIYCYQYSAVDVWTALAWRRVWQIWGEIPGNQRVKAPGLFDFLIFSLGKKCCNGYGRKRCVHDTPCNKKQQRTCNMRNNYMLLCDGYCMFYPVCSPELKKLNPPKSISIYGATGWTNGTSDAGGGGGISA